MPHGCLPQFKDFLYFIIITSWSAIPCSTHSPFTLQTSGIPNNMVWVTNIAYTKSSPCILAPAAQNAPNHVSTTQTINCNTIPQKDLMILYMIQARHTLNTQVLAKLFPSPVTPAILHYSQFSDKYSPQYGRLSLSLYFMTNILF